MTTFKVSLPDVGSWPNVNPPDAQVCDVDDISGQGRGCYDHFAVNVVPDAEWKHYEVPFALLRTEGVGLVHTYDPSKLVAIMFSVSPKNAFHDWIDDVAFYVK
jgi:hypothetical protein